MFFTSFYEGCLFAKIHLKFEQVKGRQTTSRTDKSNQERKEASKQTSKQETNKRSKQEEKGETKKTDLPNRGAKCAQVSIAMGEKHGVMKT
jgi:hypothetical protein